MAANKRPHAGPGRLPMKPEFRLHRVVAVPVTDAMYERIQLAAHEEGKSAAQLVRDVLLAADLFAESPAAVMRAMVSDPNARRTTLVRRREPESMPLPFGPQKKRRATT